MGLKRLLLLVVSALAAAVVLVPGAGAGNFDEVRMGCSGEAPAICPTGTTGQAYSLPLLLQGDEDASCAGFSVSSGTAPPGLNVSGNTLSGVPTQPGVFEFYLTATYACEFPKPASDDFFRISINPGLARLTLGPEQGGVGSATVGTSYSLQMTASVPEPKTWTINAGALPPGLTLNAATGLISGTPTAAGVSTFEVLARMASDTRSDTKTLAITVRDPLAIAGSDPFTAARRAQGEVSMRFSAMLAVTGGSGTYTWSLTSGALPPGMLFAEGTITGTPTTAGAYAFTVSVSDTEGRVANYPSSIVVAEKLAITTLLLRPGKVGKLYVAKLKTVGGVKPTTWTLVRGQLPSGVRFNRALGQLSGTPKKPGRYRVVFAATDSLGIKARKTFSIVVAASPKKSR